MTTKYVFGEYKGCDFGIKRTKTGWKGFSGDVKFMENVNFPKTFTVAEVKGKLLEKLHEDVDFYRYRLTEGLTLTELKGLLKLKLGCLSDNSSTTVETLYNDDEKTFTASAKERLENIASGKEKVRHLNTTLLQKAWVTVRGANANIRKLDSRQNAYLFAYLDNGDILEGISSSGVVKYFVNLKQLDVTDIHNRFEDAIASIKTEGLVNNFKVTGPGSSKGEAIIVTMDKKASVSELNDLQKTFRAVFTAPSEKEDKGNALVKLVKKTFSKLQDLFKTGNGKKLKDLKDYAIQGSTDIQMYYSQEEVDLAKEALLKASQFATTAKEEKPEDQVKDDSTEPSEETSEETSSEEPEESTKDVKEKPFNDTALGSRIRRRVYQQDGKPATGENKEKLDAARKAGKNIKQDWNQEDAAILLRTAADAIDNSSWTDKKKLGDVLRQIELIEKKLRTRI